MRKMSQTILNPLKEYLYLTKRSLGLFLQDKKGLFLSYIGITVLLAVVAFINPAIIGLLINKLQAIILGTDDASGLGVYVAILALIYTIPFFLYPINDYLDTLIQYYFQQVIELKVVRKWATLDMSLREDPKLNDLFYNVRSYGMNRFYQFSSRNIFILSNLVQLSIAGFIIFQINSWLFLLYLLFILPDLLVSLKFSQQIWGIWSSEAPVRRQWNVLWELLMWQNNLHEIKVNRTSPKFLGKMKSMYDDFFKIRKSAEKRKLMFQMSSLILSQAASVIIFLYLVRQVVNQEIGIGTFTFYLSSLTIFKNSIALFVGYLSNQYRDTLIVQQFFKFLDLENNIIVPQKPKPLPNKAPLIEFKNVSFRYPHSDAWIFKNIDLTFRPGEKIAIVGVNGAGKSSLVKLMLRFYDPTEGDILVNGVNLKEIDLDGYYDLIGALFQDYIRYQFIVKDAIAAGTEEIVADIDRAIMAAKESGAHEFIEKYSQQYETQLGKEFEMGIDPSVGQWQKLAMARTFYKNPKVYILDEPTASIDADAEEKIFESLGALSDDITVILISHRFSTVRHADKIVVLEDGKVIEEGSHQELLKNRGRYYELFTKQAKGYQ